MVQVCLRMAQTAALDGLQCGPHDLRHLSDVPFHGMHVLTRAPSSDGAVCSAGQGDFGVEVHVDGAEHGQPPPVVRVPCSPAAHSNADSLRDAVRGLVPAARATLHAHLRSSGDVSADTLEWLQSTAESADDDDRWALSQFLLRNVYVMYIYMENIQN